jgi:CheY-like chemotaxis protein
LSIINDILDLSKIEAGRLHIERRDVEIARIIADVCSLMDVRASEKNIRLETEYQFPVPETIQTDPIRLRQILVNVVGNAIKFTEKGHVKLIISLEQEEGQSRLRIEVKDTGIGMGKRQIARLFQPFSQADAATTRKFGGTGLGLTISKHLSEMLGGGIEVCSVMGAGSSFIITVDTGSLRGARMLQHVDETLVNLSPLDRGEGAEPGAGQAGLAGYILLAEDNKSLQKLCCSLLIKKGMTVETVDNGQEAFEAAMEAWERGAPYDLILMDMQMPVCDGYTAVRRLRDAGYKRPIIALTAHAMAGDREKCLEAGCDDYASKPIDLPGLLETIAGQLHRGESAA